MFYLSLPHLMLSRMGRAIDGNLLSLFKMHKRVVGIIQSLPHRAHTEPVVSAWKMVVRRA